MADANIVNLDQVHGVASVFGAFLRVVIRRETDDAHAGHFVLAGTANLVTVAHRLRVVVILVLVADRHQVRVESLQLEPDARGKRVRDDCRVATPQPETTMS